MLPAAAAYARSYNPGSSSTPARGAFEVGTRRLRDPVLRPASEVDNAMFSCRQVSAATIWHDLMFVRRIDGVDEYVAVLLPTPVGCRPSLRLALWAGTIRAESVPHMDTNIAANETISLTHNYSSQFGKRELT